MLATAPPHEAALREFSVLVAVGPEPVPRVVVPFAPKADGDPIIADRPRWGNNSVLCSNCGSETERLHPGRRETPRGFVKRCPP